MPDTLITVENLSKKFSRRLKSALWYGIQDLGSEIFGGGSAPKNLRRDEFWAIQDINFELKRGECLGLIGPNGSGKSTLLRILNGLIKPDRGKVSIQGRVRALTDLGTGFNPILTGRENIYTNGSILGFSKKEIDKKFDEIVDFSEIGEFIDAPVQSYSSGMKVRLGFAIAAQMEPDVLLLDEILAVGDAGFKVKCFNAVLKMLKNAAVIFVSHTMPQLARLCTNVMVMNRGAAIYRGEDILEGIQVYYSLFRRAEEVVAGNDRAAIHKVELRSNGRKEIESLDHLEELTIEADLSIDPLIKYPILNVAFLNQESQAVAHCSSQYGRLEIANPGRPFRVIIRFPKFLLSPGIYSLTMGVRDGASNEVLTNRQAVRVLRIRGDFTGFSPVHLMGEWNVLVSTPTPAV